jgi:3'(2'), 5'-bisphosphate nucleotidase
MAPDIAGIFRAAALDAGARIMAHYGDPALAVTAKADDSPVTAADLAADAAIAAILAERLPGIPVATEEQTATHAIAARRFILVDPLDGTRDFVRRSGDFTVNIALIEDGAPVAGVVFAPARRRLFYTDAAGRPVEEKGALDPVRPGPLRRLAVARPDPAALRVVASKSHRDPATDAVIAGFDVAEVVSAGSSLKFCLLAAGEADLYPRMGRTMEWDTAAAHAVLAAAGGRVLAWPGGAPLTYGKPGFVNPGFVAFVPGVPLPGAGE